MTGFLFQVACITDIKRALLHKLCKSYWFSYAAHTIFHNLKVEAGKTGREPWGKTRKVHEASFLYFDFSCHKPAKRNGGSLETRDAFVSDSKVLNLRVVVFICNVKLDV